MGLFSMGVGRISCFVLVLYDLGAVTVWLRDVLVYVAVCFGLGTSVCLYCWLMCFLRLGGLDD